MRMIRLLIVEDDSMIREGLVDCFPWREHGVDAVKGMDNGALALEEIRKSGAEILLTDIVLPGMTGIELANTLRDEGWDGQIIMMSAYQDVEYLRGALRSQSVDFLFKPMKTEELIFAVDQAVHRAEKASRLSAYDEQIWREPLRKALETPNAAEFTRVLGGALTGLQPDKPPFETLRARMISLCDYIEDEICLEDAELHIEELKTSLLKAREPDAALKMWNEGRKALTDMLAERENDWKFARKMTSIIMENIANIDSQTLANRMYGSRANFYRRFDKAYRSTLSSRILKLRMRAACELLEKGDLRVYEIAECVGYSDVDHFTGVFKKYTGFLPSNYVNEKNRNK